MTISLTQIHAAATVVLNESGLLSTQQIDEVSKELADEGVFETEGSAYFCIARMHIVINGYAPIGITDHSASIIFTPTTLMKEYVDAEFDYDLAKVEANIAQAIADCQRRAEEKRKAEALRKDREANAKKRVVSYYHDHKSELPKMGTTDRDAIAALYIDGVSMEDAFTRVLFTRHREFVRAQLVNDLNEIFQETA